MSDIHSLTPGLRAAAVSFWGFYGRRKREGACVSMIRAVDVAWHASRDIFLSQSVADARAMRSYFAALVFESALPCFSFDVAMMLRTSLLETCSASFFFGAPAK